VQAKYITGIKYGRKASKHTAPRKYGIYRQAEGPLSYIAGVENNAPSMSEKLWKIREQFTIAEKIVFDAIITLPPMDKKEAVSKIAEYIGRSRSYSSTMKRLIAKRLTREELLEVCEEIMKEAA